jgi:uncharacterized protein
MYSLLAGSLSVERLEIPIRGLPLSLDGIRLVQLSDLHWDGLRLSEGLLQQAIAATNAAKPDLIVLTGDYVTEEPEPIDQLAEHLRGLHSRYGIYAILGNHDLRFPHSQTKITTALTQAGIHVLWDQVAYPLGDRLALVGLRDYWSCRFNPTPVMSGLDPNLPRIVLSHNPDSAKTLQKWRVDLQLSGHTHGGQVVLPGFGPVVTGLKTLRQALPKPWHRWLWRVGGSCDKTVQHWKWAQGLHCVGENLLYVNRGLGTYLPGRLFCPPEVTVLTLVSKSVCSDQVLR